MTPGRFEHFVGIDWSGAVGPRQKGIAIAVARRGGPPQLVECEGGWSREKVRDWLIKDLSDNALIGLDLGIALPHADAGAYFPGWEASPSHATQLWQMVHTICAEDPNLAASSFVDHPVASRYFRRHGGREGAAFGGGRGRFRVTEQAQAAMGCRPYSNFNLVGAAQVGKSSLTGMRLLHQLRGVIPVWPIDPIPTSGPVAVEIYTALIAMAAGRSAGRTKITNPRELAIALVRLQSAPFWPRDGVLSDHQADALMTAAWLRMVHADARLWAPSALTPEIAVTEGWTFGAL